MWRSVSRTIANEADVIVIVSVDQLRADPFGAPYRLHLRSAGQRYGIDGLGMRDEQAFLVTTAVPKGFLASPGRMAAASSVRGAAHGG